MTLREVLPGQSPFRRNGLGYIFEPPTVPVVMKFSPPTTGDEPECEVHLLRPDGQTVARRRIRLMAGTSRGAIAELCKELGEWLDVDWRGLFREACESVLVAHRRGPEMRVVDENNIPSPQPLEWLIDGLLLKGKLNCWLGVGSTGKSTLAKAACVYHAAGYNFLDLPTRPGRPLYLDWEDDFDSFARTTQEVCRNLGAWPPPWMGYKDMHGRRLKDNLEQLAEDIERWSIDLLVIDSISPAGGPPGDHATWEQVAAEMESALGKLPSVTVLGIDHVTGDEHRNNGKVPVKGRGSERKYEMFRNQWTLMPDLQMRASGHHVVNWVHTKNNLGVYRDSFTVTLLHRGDELSLIAGGVADSPDAVDRMPSIDRLLHEIRERGGRQIKDLSLAVRQSDTRSAIEATRIEAKRLERRGAVAVDNVGGWWAADANTANTPANSLQTPEEPPELAAAPLPWWVKEEA